MSSRDPSEPGVRSIVFRLFPALFFFYSAIAGAHFYSMDDYTNFFVVQSIWETGDFSVDVAPEARHLNTVKGADGRAYSYYGIGGPLVFFPFFAVGRTVGDALGVSHYLSMAAMSLTNSAMTAAAATLLFVVLSRVGRPIHASLAAAIIYAVATPALVWAKHGSNTTITAGLLIAALCTSLASHRFRFLYVGFLLGFSVNVRFDAAICVVAFLAFIALREQKIRPLLETTAGGLPFLLLLFWYNTHRFGSPLEFNYPDAKSADAFSNPILSGLYGLLISPNGGIFFYSPILLMVSVGWAAIRRSDRTLLVPAVLLPGCYILFHSVNPAWHGGLGWGPRYLGTVLPFLVLGLGFLEWRKPLVRSLGVSLVCLSVIFQVPGSMISSDSYHDRLVESGLNPVAATREPSLAPILGIPRMIGELTLERPETLSLTEPLPQGGFPATQNLRLTPDYWPFYAYKMGISAGICLVLWMVPASASVILGIGLLRQLTAR